MRIPRTFRCGPLTGGVAGHVTGGVAGHVTGGVTGRLAGGVTGRLAGGLAMVLVCALLAGPAAAAAPVPGHPTPGATRPAAPWPLSFLHVGPAQGPAGLPQILDATGRAVLLRGVNVNGLIDYWRAGARPLAPSYPIDPADYRDGRCPPRDLQVESMTVCAFDAGQWRHFGYDAIRLGVSWSLLEPTPGHLDATYLARIAQVVRWAGRAGVYVVIDFHQDAWSRYLYTPSGASCPPPTSPVTGWHEADGAPAWASVHLAPVCQLAQRELDPAVAEDFQRFWSDLPAPDGVGLVEHFARMVAAVAARFAQDPAVAGYDLFNEPSPGTQPPEAFDETTLFPFYAKVIATVRRTVPGFRQLFFLEPDITRDVTDLTGPVVPWSTFSPYHNVVFSPHVYTRVFTADADLAGIAHTPTFLPMSEGYRTAVAEARALGTPLWIGEFGNVVANDATQLAAHYANQDADDLGSSLWVWKADADRQGGVVHASFSVLHGPFGRGVAFPSRVLYTARAYPVYLTGRLTRLSYHARAATFRLAAVAPPARPGHGSPTVIFLPARASGVIEVAGGRARVQAIGDGNRVLTVYPRGGPYWVRVRAASAAAQPSSGRDAR